MDKDTRSAIERATQRARAVLEADYAEQLEGTYDVLLNGDVPAKAGAHLDDAQHLDRERIVAAVRHKEAAGMGCAEAVRDYLRDAAFTTLNRFAALKMLEARELVQECVSKGEQSAGYREFCGLAAPLALLPDGRGYRLYIECLFDELSQEIKVLFDRRDAASVLWPRRQAVTELLGVLNDQALAAVWGQDETIGWVYQYFNSSEERRAMRDTREGGSQAPRNSRELAVRNQFFTPRYVVQFLTDSTLGRTWYEMQQGRTRLVDQCQYMVRRPRPVFLQPGDTEPAPWVPADGFGDPDLPGDMWVRPNPELSDFDLISRYALTVGGYDYARQKLGVECGDLANDRLSRYHDTKRWEGTFEELRCCLFFEQRRHHHFGEAPEGDDLEAIQALNSAVCQRWDLETDFIPYRAPKDPRDITILDPACGSGHFLLYAFDLLLTMYEEAWTETGACSQSTGRPLRDDYPSIESLRAALPGLILRHNLHGVDIDPRCAQIAALALWMRAARAHREYGLARAERPPVARTNIVIAEPMPGDRALAQEFATRLEPPLLRDLFQGIVEEMRLAGELGSLLRVEDCIAGEVRRAREQFVERQRELRKGFLPGFQPPQGELDLSGIDDGSFFEEAEARILAALREFAETASGAANVRRRLFAGDSAQGLALIELLRSHFDVVLMNPPFGEPTGSTKQRLHHEHPDAGGNLLAMFVSRGREVLEHNGRIGAVTSNTALFYSSFSEWRQRLFFRHSSLDCVADLGGGVLEAKVKVAAFTVTRGYEAGVVTCFRLLEEGDKERRLAQALYALADRNAQTPEYVHVLSRAAIHRIPNVPLAYWAPKPLLDLYGRLPYLVDGFATPARGIDTGDNDRFLRAWWEIPTHDLGEGWVPYAKGGVFAPYLEPPLLVLRWKDRGRELCAHSNSYLRNVPLQRKRGVSYSLRAAMPLCGRCLPEESIFSGVGPAILPGTLSEWAVLGLINSQLVRYLAGLALGGATTGTGGIANAYHVGVLQKLVVPDSCPPPELVERSRAVVEELRPLETRSETSPYFESVFGGAGVGDEASASTLPSVGRLTKLLTEVDEVVERWYGLDVSIVRTIRSAFDGVTELHHLGGRSVWTKEERRFRVLQFAVGLAFGRWGTAALTSQGAFDPFASLSGQAAWQQTRIRHNDAVLVDDPGHPRDIIDTAAHCLAAYGLHSGQPAAASLARELSGDDWRELIRDKSARGFWLQHAQAYSTAERHAPIYWQLATRSAKYSVWLYYPALSRDTLHKLLTDCVDPKLLLEECRLAELGAAAAGDANPAHRRAIAVQEELVEELRAFRADIASIAPIWNPNPEDGVGVTFAPLWRLMRHQRNWQKELCGTWERLCTGSYDWSHLAMHLWPERVVPKCRSDRSLAIAHGLEGAFWYEDKKGKWQPREDVDDAYVARLVRERTSPAVKAALADLLAAPAPGTSRGRPTRRRATNGRGLH